MTEKSKDSVRSLAPSMIDEETGQPARSNRALFVIVLIALLVVGGAMLLGMRWMEGQAPPGGDCEPKPECLKR